MKQLFNRLLESKALGMLLIIGGSILIPFSIIALVVSDNAWVEHIFGGVLTLLVVAAAFLGSWKLYELSYICLFEGDALDEYAFGTLFALFGAFIGIGGLIVLYEGLIAAYQFLF